ncbi:MAG: glycosyltransferase family 2 protein [Gammaproteobacteria bacterium]|nr:glycosyltransferase family 2 protein [Gammaproteobacteria bacterium]
MRISVIIPVLNEEEELRIRLPALQWLRAQGHELIVVDGGSQDASIRIAKPYVDQLISTPAGRAVQMNGGAQAARGDLLLFLHIDTQMEAYNLHALEQQLGKIHSMPFNLWGRFDVRLSGKHIMFRIIATLMNLRSRITGVATGDQGIFVTRELFQAAGMFATIPLMEDIELSKRLKRIVCPLCLTSTITTSSRRWEAHGIARTIRLMWRLRFAYWMGKSPAELAREYRR